MVNYKLLFMVATNKIIKQNKTIGTKITPKEYEEITGLVNDGLFLNGSDFVREAIRDKLRNMKLVKDNLNHDNVKKSVLTYFQSHKNPYISDVANDLELDIELVIKITKELIKEGKIIK